MRSPTRRRIVKSACSCSPARARRSVRGRLCRRSPEARSPTRRSRLRTFERRSCCTRRPRHDRRDQRRVAGAGFDGRARVTSRIAIASGAASTPRFSRSASLATWGPWTLAASSVRRRRELYMLPDKFGRVEAFRIGLVSNVRGRDVPRRGRCDREPARHGRADRAQDVEGELRRLRADGLRWLRRRSRASDTCACSPTATRGRPSQQVEGRPPKFEGR